MSWFKIGGGIAGLLALVGVLLWVKSTLEKAAEADAYRACEHAAPSVADPLDRCPKATRARIETARRAEACDAAIGTDASQPDPYLVRVACSAPVKALEARAATAAINEADARSQLAIANARNDAALARAEARAATTATRKADNDRTLSLAPRTADGRVRCDADCLRQLAD